MSKRGCYFLLIQLMMGGLSGCLGTVWTGATTIYDRHSIYEKMSDYQLLVNVNDVLAINRTFNNSSCLIDIAVFNGDILLAGHVPSENLMDELQQRMRKVKGYRRLYNEIKMKQIKSNSIQDSWITTKIRSQIFSDSSINPNAFKIVTSDRIVYLMGDVKADQAEKVIKIARYTDGVVQVVKMLRYYTYQTTKNMA